MDAKGVVLPFKDTDLKMFLIVPNKQDGLKTLLPKLSPESPIWSKFGRKCVLRDLFSEENYQSSRVDLNLPRFRLECKFGLNEVMKNLGAQQIFVDANLKGITEADDLFVSEIVHRAVLEVSCIIFFVNLIIGQFHSNTTLNIRRYV